MKNIDGNDMKKIKKIESEISYLENNEVVNEKFFLDIDINSPENKQLLEDKKKFRLSQEYGKELKSNELREEVIKKKSAILQEKNKNFVESPWFLMVPCVAGLMPLINWKTGVPLLINVFLSLLFVISFTSMVLWSFFGSSNRKPYGIILMKNSREEIIHQRDYIFHHLVFKSDVVKNWWLNNHYEKNNKVVNFFKLKQLNKEVKKQQKLLNSFC